MQLLVKVRVSLARMPEFGDRLQRGELDRSAIKATYCLRQDPAVGLGIWDVTDMAEFERKFGPWRRYYEEIEINEVVTPAEAQCLLAHDRQAER